MAERAKGDVERQKRARETKGMKWKEGWGRKDERAKEKEDLTPKFSC